MDFLYTKNLSKYLHDAGIEASACACLLSLRLRLFIHCVSGWMIVYCVNIFSERLLEDMISDG